MEAILLGGRQFEYNRHGQITLDAEAALMEAESEIHRVPGEYSANESYTGSGQQLISFSWKEAAVRTFTAGVKYCADTSLHVGSVPGFSGAHS